MEVLVVLPTYNESANIDTVLRRVRAALPAASVLVVDDGSPDGTADIAERIGKELGNVEVMRRHEKSGLGSAYRAGFRWGLERGFDACVEMDSDLSHEPEALPELVAPLSEGYELVIGSRYVPGGRIPNWAWHRRLLSRGGNVYASLLLGPGCGRFDGRISCLRGHGPPADRPRFHPGRRLRLPDRDDLRHHPLGGRGDRGADPIRRPGRGGVEDVHLHRGRSPRPRDLVGPAAGDTRLSAARSTQRLVERPLTDWRRRPVKPSVRPQWK